MNQFEIRIAKVISVILHPLLIPTYASIIVFNLKFFFFFILPLQSKLILLANVFGFTFLIPAFAIYIMTRLSVIKSYYMDLKNERTIPLLITGIFYYMTYYMFRNVNLPAMFYNFFLVSAILVIIAFIINYFWKISLHSIALGGFTAFILALFLKFNFDTRLLFLAAVFLSGLAASARLMLNAHIPSQIYAGYLLGFAGMLSLYMFVM